MEKLSTGKRQRVFDFVFWISLIQYTNLQIIGLWIDSVLEILYICINEFSHSNSWSPDHRFSQIQISVHTNWSQLVSAHNPSSRNLYVQCQWVIRTRFRLSKEQIVSFSQFFHQPKSTKRKKDLGKLPILPKPEIRKDVGKNSLIQSQPQFWWPDSAGFLMKVFNGCKAQARKPPRRRHFDPAKVQIQLPTLEVYVPQVWTLKNFGLFKKPRKLTAFSAEKKSFKKTMNHKFPWNFA